MLPRSSLFFADLHFHSLYSDNRDRASIEEMLLMGLKRNVSIFGVADHNHNLDVEKWQRAKKDMRRLNKKYPALLVMLNCEITFLLGHLLILKPQRIRGSIREGYHFLYHSQQCLKVLAHPMPYNARQAERFIPNVAGDEWHERFLPDAAGIEVINGDVLRKARERRISVVKIIDIPMVRLYARYLEFGYPIAAIGNSDAHELAEMGSGLTGIWLEAPLTSKAVLAAISRYKTFATTDPGIRLRCKIEDNTNILSWQVDWNPLTSQKDDQYIVEIYRGEHKLHTTARSSGRIEIRTSGLFWVAAFNTADYAVSSPLRFNQSSDPTTILKKDVPLQFLQKPLKDLAFLQLPRRPKSEFSQTRSPDSTRVELYSWHRVPFIIDAAGKSVPYKISLAARERVIIDKCCPVPHCDELFLWLQRNEIHEYVFLELNYRKEAKIFYLQARIVPALMVLIRDFHEWHRAALPCIRRLITSSTECRLNVRTLYKSTLMLQLGDHPFPLRLKNQGERASSLLVQRSRGSENRTAGRYLKTCPGQVTQERSGDRIFQIFVSPLGCE